MEVANYGDNRDQHNSCKQITIWDDRITVELKSGVSIDVDA